MTSEESKKVAELFEQVFTQAASDLTEIVNIAVKIKSKSIDIHQLLRSSEEGAKHEDTEKYYKGIKRKYDVALFRLSTCAADIK